MLDELGKGGKTHERAQATQELDQVNGTNRDSYPGLPADYFARRLEDLDMRGEIVRRYRETATELYRSLLDDIRSGRKRSAFIHFRSLVDWCLGALFVAYPARREELDRGSLPNDPIKKAARIIAHWGLGVGPREMENLAYLYHRATQAMHGSPRSAREIGRWAEQSWPWIERACGLLMEGVEEADHRLNGHPKQTPRSG